MSISAIRSPTAMVRIALLAVVATGCAGGRIKTYPVTGQVLYNGEPLAGVDIAFHAVDPSNNTGYPPHATTGADGRFVLRTFLHDDGAPAGEFRVAIAFAVEAVEEGSDQSKKSAFQVPAKYHRAETSELIARIQPGPNVLDPFRLEGPPSPKRKS